MKNTIILGILGIALTACGATMDNKLNVAKADSSKALQHDVLTAAVDTPATILAPTAGINPLGSVYDAYFELKNALAKDNGKSAQIAGENLLDNIASIESSALTAEQNEVWTKYKSKLSFDAEHISSVDKNEHQREHFVTLSKNMHEVMKTIKYDKPVYYQNCPMYNNGKGANWLSLENKISNPYLGKSMPTCGSTIETVK
ncbi:MAG: DUF3347 domain-containing protein [Bacteroidia bacterium]